MKEHNVKQSIVPAEKILFFTMDEIKDLLMEHLKRINHPLFENIKEIKIWHQENTMPFISDGLEKEFPAIQLTIIEDMRAV
jgi:hypothetical protein